MKKLLILTQTVDKNDPILGFFCGWLKEFSKYFDRVDVICLGVGEYDLPSHVHIHSLGKEKGTSKITQLIRFYVYFARAFFSRADYVFFHMGAIYNVLAAPFFLLRRSYGIKFLWWKTHGKVNHLKERLALKFVDEVATAGSKSFELSKDKVRVVGHAIDVEKFTMENSMTHRDLKKILIVGRVTPIKKIEVAIETIMKLHKLGRDVKLHIVGTIDDLNYKKLLKEKFVDKTSSKIVFIGSQTQDELMGEYQSASILLHPAYEAGFDKVVLEAMSSGVIPITSIPSFKSILEPFNLFIEPNDVEGYVQRSMGIIDMDSEERCRLSNELRNIVVVHHSIKTLTQRIFNIE